MFQRSATSFVLLWENQKAQSVSTATVFELLPGEGADNGGTVVTILPVIISLIPSWPVFLNFIKFYGTKRGKKEKSPLVGIINLAALWKWQNDSSGAFALLHVWSWTSFSHLRIYFWWRLIVLGLTIQVDFGSERESESNADLLTVRHTFGLHNPLCRPDLEPRWRHFPSVDKILKNILHEWRTTWGGKPRGVEAFSIAVHFSRYESSWNFHEFLWKFFPAPAYESGLWESGRQLWRSNINHLSTLMLEPSDQDAIKCCLFIILSRSSLAKKKRAWPSVSATWSRRLTQLCGRAIDLLFCTLMKKKDQITATSVTYGKNRLFLLLEFAQVAPSWDGTLPFAGQR